MDAPTAPLGASKLAFLVELVTKAGVEKKSKWMLPLALKGMRVMKQGRYRPGRGSEHQRAW